MEKHYGLVEWMEFVRGKVPEEIRSRMSSHLEGCSDCRKTAGFFEKLANVCRDMIPDKVPDSMVQRARAICPQNVLRQPRTARQIPVELMYDSSRAPAPVGLRASKTTGCRVLYRAGNWSLDFHLEHGLESPRISVVGQILTEESPQSVSYIPVALKSGNTTVAETLSNQFGEFRMECKPRKNLRLRIYLEQETQFIEVPLQSFGNDKGGERN